MGRNHRRHPATRPGREARAAPQALGIDIGRVIIKPGDTAGDTSFLQGSDADAMRTPPNPGALPTITRLVAAFEGRVWLVSKCGPRIQARTRRWLAHHRFFERTGMPADQLRFCRKRPEKAPICEALGLDAFIDDRPDVLRPMEGIVAWRYLFGPQRRRGPWAPLIPVRDWDEVAAHLLTGPRDADTTASRSQVPSSSPESARARV